MRSSSAVLASVLVAASLPAGAAEWRIAPTINSGVDYVDNPRLLSDGDESYAGGQAELQADMSVATEVSSLSLTPRFVYARYPDDPLLDRNDAYVVLSGKRLYETVSWNGSASFTRDTTITSEFGLTGFQYTNRDREALSVSLGPTWQMTERVQTSVQTYFLDSKYEDAQFTGLVDYTYALASMSGAYVLGETLTAGLQASAGELDAEATSLRSRDLDATLSLDWRISERWRTNVAYGPTRVESERGSSDGYVYSAALARENLRSGLRLLLERDVTPTGRGVLVVRDNASLTFSYSLTPTMTWALWTRVGRTRDAIEVDGVHADAIEYASVESNLRWRFAERWSVALVAGGRYASHTQRADAAEGFNVKLGLSWSGQPHTVSR